MSHKPLKTYLRSYRRRSYLTQDETAFLIGSMCGTTVSRHERGLRLPEIENLMAYAIVLDVSVADLYKGVHHSVQETVASRARGMLNSLKKRPRTPIRDHKIAHLEGLLARCGSTSP